MDALKLYWLGHPIVELKGLFLKFYVLTQSHA